MRRALLLFILVLLVAVGVLVRAPLLAAQTSAQVQIGKVALSKVADWQRGTLDGLLVSNNADGELRLADGSKSGTFTSAAIQAVFPPNNGAGTFNAVGAVWKANVPVSTTLQLEVRGGSTTTETAAAAWQPLPIGDARSQTDDGALALESVRMFPATSAFLQFRATLSTAANNASPELQEISFSFLNATNGPPHAAGLPRVPAPYGQATLTTPPQIIQRDSWGAPAPTIAIVRQTPRGIILHQIGADDVADAPPFLRALAAYDTEVLGWDDLPFHFVIDRDGTIFAGRAGGPTATVARFSGGDAAIHVALIGSSATPSQQQSALASLLAWLGQAYDIPPTGQHTLEASNGTPTTRPNIVTHFDVAPESGDPSPELRVQLDPLRQNADQITVRARWYFAEGNALNFQERLAVLNPSGGTANVRFNLLRQPGPAVLRDATVPSGGRADLVVNEQFNDTTDVPAIIESNAPVVAERFMSFGNDITAGPGVSQPSRVWYFAEGSTSGTDKTYLLLFNPQSADANATITYMQNDGRTAQQQVKIAPLQRTVVTVGDGLVDAGFGARVIATAPIVVERTMIFGPDSSATTGGVHTAHGIVKLSRHWYFAEGTTQAPFQMNILVLNPNAQPANVAVTFLTDSGTSLTRKYAVPPQTRLPINVNEVVPELGIATTVVSDRPVAAERAMYWNNSGGSSASPTAGAANAGATEPAFTWLFADGRTSDNFLEYLLLSNPSQNQARVTVEFVLADGKKGAQSVVMAGGSRYTLAAHQLYPGQVALAATVRSTQPIVAERSLYPGAPGSATNRGGATALGVPEVAP
jgi:hypothetical protein